MAIQTLKLAGRRFVVLPESEFRKLTGKSVPRAPSKRVHRINQQDQEDSAEAMRRLADPNEKRIPWSQVKKSAGLA